MNGVGSHAKKSDFKRAIKEIVFFKFQGHSKGGFAHEKIQIYELWHLSPLALAELWDEERRTGKIVYPEEA